MIHESHFFSIVILIEKIYKSNSLKIPQAIILITVIQLKYWL
jgi:hypothetical protein